MKHASPIKATRWLFATVVLLTSACANQNSIFRVADTDASKTETILIDAKQRPITVNTVSDPKHPTVCIARNADALSQFAASGNLKIDQASGGGGELGFAAAEQVTSIAFRTQVTEAQQEYLYYLCQLNANNTLSVEDVSDNLRHFQNTMLAMIAVDDLATAQKASTPAASDTQQNATTDQPAAPTPPDAKLGAITDASTSADNAKNAAKSANAPLAQDFKSVTGATTTDDAKAKSKALTAALKTYDAKEKAYASKLAALQSAVRAAAGKDAAAPDDVSKASADSSEAMKSVKSGLDAVNSANADVSAATDTATLKTAQTSLTSKADAYQTADTASEKSLDTLGAAVKAWGTSVAKASSKATQKPPAASSANNPAAVASAVASIVQTVVWQSFITEKCLKAFLGEKQSTNADARTFCLWHLKMADLFRFAQLAYGTANNSNAQLNQDPLLNQGPLRGIAKPEDFAPPK
jgi:hypothetical protein